MRTYDLPESKPVGVRDIGLTHTAQKYLKKPSTIIYSMAYTTIYLLMVFLLITAGCSTVALSVPHSTPPSKQTEKPEGFLSPENLPDSIVLIAAPPATGSAAFAADEETYRNTRSLRESPRWDLAARDANLTFPDAAEIFSCALDAPITEAETPHLYNLLLRTKADASRATGKAKSSYRRIRPYVTYNDTTCTPDYEERMRKSGSYPSAHSSIGWAWALILVEIAPARTSELLARGLEFGSSRVICGVHWQSDVMAGSIVGAGVVARLHADPSFRALMDAARSDVERSRKKGLKPRRDCGAEAAALKHGTTKLP